jgi:membrane associated rhomboid family serine protease
VLALVGVVLAAYVMQVQIGADAVAAGLGFAPADLARGRIVPLFAALFLHGGWAHVLFNSAFILAFGTPVSRAFGTNGAGALGFVAFYMTCGVLANLGYAAMHPGSPEVLVGASGAASGLMAGSSRLMTPGPGLARFLSPPVLSMAGAWLAINGLLAGLQAMGLAGLEPGAGGATVAWEAHIAGYAAGLVLFAPALRLIRRL